MTIQAWVHSQARPASRRTRLQHANAWRNLRAQGVYVNTNPHSSFLYLLTSLHAVHLVGGLIALVAVTVAALRLRVGFRKRNVAEVTAIYWHFMDVLWIYLFVLLFFLK